MNTADPISSLRAMKFRYACTLMTVACAKLDHAAKAIRLRCADGLRDASSRKTPSAASNSGPAGGRIKLLRSALSSNSVNQRLLAETRGEFSAAHTILTYEPQSTYQSTVNLMLSM